MRRTLRRKYIDINSTQELRKIRDIVENEWASPRDGGYNLSWYREWDYKFYRKIMNK